MDPFLRVPHHSAPDLPHPSGLISCGACPTRTPSLARWAGSATLWLPHRSSGMDGRLSGSYQTRSRSFLNLCSPVWISWHPARPPNRHHHHLHRHLHLSGLDAAPLLCPVPQSPGATPISPLLLHKSLEKSRERKKRSSWRQDKQSSGEGLLKGQRNVYQEGWNKPLL